MTRRKSGCVSGEAFHAMSRNATRASDATDFTPPERFCTETQVPKRREGRNFNPTLSARLFTLSGTSPAVPAARHGTVAAFRAPHGRFGQRVHLAFVTLRPIFVSRIPCPLHRPDHLRRIRTGQPEHLRNLARREFPCRARAAEQHSLVHRQAIFPLETLFELGDRARHFAYAARAHLFIGLFQRISSIAFLNASLGIAPCNICGLPLIGMKRIDGMLRMPNAAARSGSFSVLTLHRRRSCLRTHRQALRESNHFTAGAAPREA